MTNPGTSTHRQPNNNCVTFRTAIVHPSSFPPPLPPQLPPTPRLILKLHKRQLKSVCDDDTTTVNSRQCARSVVLPSGHHLLAATTTTLHQTRQPTIRAPGAPASTSACVRAGRPVAVPTAPTRRTAANRLRRSGRRVPKWPRRRNSASPRHPTKWRQLQP